jgi:hypothetical protein
MRCCKKTVNKAPVRDLLLRAKHLFVAAKVARMRPTLFDYRSSALTTARPELTALPPPRGQQRSSFTGRASLPKPTIAPPLCARRPLVSWNGFPDVSPAPKPGKRPRPNPLCRKGFLETPDRFPG